MQTVKYDECGNVVQKISGSGNIVDFKYDLDVVGNIGQDKTKDPDYLRETWNLVYGKSNWFKFSCMGQKIIDWTPQEDTTYYNYEPIFYRPHKIIRKGDTDLRPSVLYEYHDIYPTYTKITRKQNEITDNYTSIFYYDKNGYLKNEQQGDIEIDYEHNNSGLLVMESIPHYLTEINPSKYKYFYDCLKRVKQIIYPDNSCTYNTFGGGVKKTFDSKGDSIIYNYDLFGRLSSVVDAINNTTSYMYNTIDNLTYIKTPDNKEYRFHYNPIGRLKGKYDVDTDTSYYHYNKDGNLDSLQDANLMASDKYLVNRYDPIGRIVRSLVKNNSDSIVLTQNYYDKYDFSDQNEYGQETPGESLSVSMPDNNSINYSLLPAQSSITSNDSILITYQPFVPLGQDTIASWTSPFDSYIDINGNVYNNDKLIVSSTPQAYNILYSFPIFSQRNRDITGSLLSPFETSLRPGAIIDSAVFSLHTVSFKDYASIKINVCNPLPFLSDGCVISPQAIPNAPSLNIDPYNAAGWHPFMFKDICQYFCDASLNDYNNDFDESYTFPSVKFAVDNPSIGYPHTEYYSGDNATTTDHPKLEIYLHSPDSETPKLARLSAEPSLNSCDINWNYSNDWTYDTLEWGNSPSYGNVIASNCTSLVHTANITGLNPRTEYHFRIKARDVTGNSTISGNYMFITDTLSFTAYSVSDVKTTSAVVKWELNWPAEVSLKYGLNPQCSFTAPIEQFSSCLTGLMPGKKYYVMLEAVNGFEKIKSPVFSFRTIGICMFSDSIGHLTKIIDQSGETVFGYDDLGRKTTKRVKYNDFNKYFYYHYNYDRANNLIYSTYPDGVVNTYNYDGYNNLCSFYKDNNKLKEFSYTASGACSTETYNNGVSSIYSYYPRLWLKNAVITKGASKYFSHEYSYDVVGNLIKDKDNTGLSSSIDRSYSYDPLNRLSNEIIGRMVSYDDDQILYDAMGNRIRNINTTYQYYPGTNRLQKEIAADGLEKTYGYDANGNMNNDGIWNYEYNAQNKLKKVYKYVSNGSTNIEYLYNASGLRIKEKKTDVVSNTNAALDAVTFPETFDDLVESAPTGDGHDDARDLGKLKVHVSDSFLFFTIEHKYLYGTSQGDYENIYIAMDTDQEFGSGSTLLPDDIKVSVSADNAWEYCAYVYSEKDFGIYIGEGFKLENLTTAGGKKMKVNFTNGKNSKAIIKIPLELIGNAKKIRFAIISTMPGAPSYVETSVCDVLPGGRLALDGTLITQYNEFVAPAPGTSITTVETKYNLYDDGGQALCDLDEYGNITRRYVYANGKHVAMDLPGNKDYMQNGGFEYGNFEYPLTPWIKWVPYALPACNWTIVSDVKRTGTYSLTAGPFVYSDPIDASTNTFENYAQNVSLPALPFIASCYMKAQDLTGGVYLLIECWTAGYGSFLGNVTSNLKTGTFDWSLISIPVNILPTGTGAVKITLQRLNGTGTVWVDDVRCEEGVSRKEDKSYYYHTDYLGSPRMMTDQLGNVIWRQDYYAFGADYNTSATGNTHKFTGHVQDVATGQYYAKARYFTTNNGRWSQPEPLLKGVPAKSFLGNPQKLNPYVYCLNNPIKFYDPNGLKIQYAPELEEYIKQAKKSKTFSKMFENLDKDETILLTIGSKILPAKVYGKTTFMPSSGQYSKSILMTIDLFKSYKYKTLGHEFKHAEEQADKNVKTMDDIKWDTMDDSGGGCTKAAAETGETVAREVENPETPPKEDPEKVEVLVGWDEVIEVSVDPDTGAWILP
jgi:RHS repeat-associated protein